MPAQHRRYMDRLPEGLPPEFPTEACLAASRRIRLERQLAYDRPVTLLWEAGELTLLPIRRAGPNLYAPFHFDGDTHPLDGELVLGDRDPLPLLVSKAVPDEDVARAWAYALLGLADATCFQLGLAEPAQGLRRQGASSTKTSRKRSLRTLPHRRTWPSNLKPIGRWAAHSGALVAGHRRRLNNGQTASPDANYRARMVGITLDPGETWVRPHPRGLPKSVEVRFAWHPLMATGTDRGS